MPWTAVLGEGFQTPLGTIQTPPRSNYTGLAYSSKMKPYVPHDQNISILSIEPKNWQTAVLEYMFPNPYGIDQAPLWANFLGYV